MGSGDRNHSVQHIRETYLIHCLSHFITAYNKVNKDELMYFSLDFSFSVAYLLSSSIRVYVRPLAPRSTLVNTSPIGTVAMSGLNGDLKGHDGP